MKRQLNIPDVGIAPTMDKGNGTSTRNRYGVYKIVFGLVRHYYLSTLFESQVTSGFDTSLCI